MPALSRQQQPSTDLLLLTSILAVTCSLPAQQFQDNRPSPLSNQRPYDVDRDGLPDLLHLDQDGALSMQRNLGNLRFAAPQLIAVLPGSPSGLVQPADVDGDLDTDFLLVSGGAIGNSALRLDLARQQAPNTFVVVPLASVPVTGSNYPVGLVSIDFDSDGDRDLVLSSTAPAGANHYALRNDGGLVYTDVTSTWFAGVQISASAMMFATDVDGDNRSDLLVLDRLLRNTGTQFVNETALRLPSQSLADLVVGDLDGDGDEDILANAVFNNLRLWSNQNGIYVDTTAVSLPAAVGPAQTGSLFDIDGDGDRDAFLLLPAQLSSGQYQQGALVLRNDGTGRLLQQVAVAPFLVAYPNTLATAADLEADGDLDVVMQTTTATLLLGDGTGVLQRAFRDPPTGLAADMNGDGRPDLLREDGIELRFAPQQGVLRPWVGGEVLIRSIEQVADIDSDGDLDVCDPRVWRNDGTGTLTLDPGASPFGGGGLCVLADLDGDGDPDIVRASSVVQWAANNGAGQFGPATSLPPTSGVALSPSAGDADADGDIDLAISGVLGAPRVLLNQGNATFVTLPLPTPVATRVRWLDLRGNGQVDLVATSAPATKVFRVVAGALVDVTATMAPAGLPGFDFAVGDVDLDGDTDVVGSALLRHDGAGNYTVEPLGIGGAQQLIDLDGDRDLDVAGFVVLENRERRLSLPIEAHIGRPLRVDIVAAPGRAQGEVAVLCLSLTQRVPPLASPIGELHLATLDAFWPLALPNISGLAEIDLPVPNAPGIVGIELFLQTLHSGPAGLGLGNVVSTRIE